MIWERYQLRPKNRIDSEYLEQYYSPEVLKVMKPGNMFFTVLHMYNDENKTHFKHMVGLIIQDIVGDKFISKLHCSNCYDIHNNTCDTSICMRTLQVPMRAVFGIALDAPENANIRDLLNFYIDLCDNSSDEEDECDEDDFESDDEDDSGQP
jgi:hypothetical protein